ncbi:MAG TPA: YebC/PmpR family DNA-binding transcriptional regulator [Candidatus Hydrogenedentes bacterium]|jgi:YebC/PmpR family DNA-binding regulatory protein|nr:YebC/PmpR family DNA-binding transcriptional regulator [FCB group bacterium]HPA06718.1 YebC/PmpR family DNA-binding transcriptional regulator [Candidatus Hydrogenedentota bacterium]
MSGHSKWSTIKRKKGALDAKRGKIFSRLAKEISVAAKTGGGDADMNPRLRTVLLAARAENMPKDNIDRAIKKGTGELPGVTYEEARYEGYGPSGVALIVDVLTDNKNRTVSEIRHLLTRYGGSMAETGAVVWNFEQKGSISIERGSITEEQIFEKAIEAGAEDVDTDSDDVFVISTEPHDLHAVAAAFEEMGMPAKSAELTMIPKTTVRVEGNAVSTILKLMEALEEHDDVQNVFANFDIPDEAMAAALEE